MPATKKTRKAPAKKQSAPKPKAPKGDVPDPFTDLTTGEDSQSVPGHFVDVTGGEHEGRYGVLIGKADDDKVIIRTRDDDSIRIVVAYKDTKPAEAGRR